MLINTDDTLVPSFHSTLGGVNSLETPAIDVDTLTGAQHLRCMKRPSSSGSVHTSSVGHHAAGPAMQQQTAASPSLSAK